MTTIQNRQINYTISPEIFAKFPGYIRGLVVATNIDNAMRDEGVLVKLRKAESAVALKTTLDSLLASPNVINWREAFRKMGANPSEFRPSHEALARRALQRKPLPDINSAVNIGNTVSLRHSIPVGVHPLDDVNCQMELRVSQGDETFVAFGSEKHETPRPGEIVFVAENEVLSRCWVWRQSRSSVTLPTSRAIVVNVDGLSPIGETEIAKICYETEEMIHSACGGKTAIHILSAKNPTATISLLQ